MHFLNVHSHRMQNPICFYTILEQYNMFGESLSISTVICAIKEPRVVRHMNTEVALFTAAVEQRIAQHSSCDCHHSVVRCALFVAVGDGGVWWCQPPLHSSASFEGKKSRHETCQVETGEQPQPLFNCMWFRGRSPCFYSVFMYCIIRRTVILHSWLSPLWRTH